MEICMPARRNDLVTREVDGELLVLDRPAGRIHQLNETASYVWHRCDGCSPVRSVAEDLAAAYSLAVEAAERDITQTIAKFRELGLVALVDRDSEQINSG